MRQPLVTTTVTLMERRSRFHNLRKLCIDLGLPQSKIATLSRIIRNVGPVSLPAENEVRAALGLPLIIPATAPAPVCPHCGIVHAVGDCHGIAGQPVILPPDARIQRQRRKRPTPTAVKHAADNLAAIMPQPIPSMRYSRAWWAERVKANARMK